VQQHDVARVRLVRPGRASGGYGPSPRRQP